MNDGDFKDHPSDKTDPNHHQIRHRVQWDEDGLRQAAIDISTVQARKRDGLKDISSDPKTPYPRDIGGVFDGEDEDQKDQEDSRDNQLDELKLSGSEGSCRQYPMDAESSHELSEHEDFLLHRREHYKHDGDALHLGKALIDSSGDDEDLMD